MKTILRAGWMLCAASLSVLACGSSSSAEADSAETRYELEEPVDRLPDGLAASYAVLPLAEGTMAVVGTRLIYIANGSKTVTTIQDAPRFHGDLATDDTYVYYATQTADRYHPATFTTLTNPSEADGKIYRVTKKPPFKPEPLVAVNILSGAFAIEGGHLFICESPGINGEGHFVDLALADPTKTVHPQLGYNEFCYGLAADRDNLFFLLDRTKRGAEPEPKFVLGSAVRDVSAPWSSSPRVTVVAPTDVDPTEVYAHSTSLFARNDDLIMVTGADATVYSKKGIKSGSLSGGARLGLARPFDKSNWVWSIDSNGGKEGGRLCEGGRLFAGLDVPSAKLLTQNVCDVHALAASDKELFFLETANILESGTNKNTVRHRLKVLPRPTL